jgi:iron complex transport system substrate-binding protein
MFPPERIVCLTEETVETLYLLGEGRRIVGISGYVVRPPRARREKPRVSAFTSADIPKILDLKPDLVLTFSDLQADIAATLIKQGVIANAVAAPDRACFIAMASLLEVVTMTSTFCCTNPAAISATRDFGHPDRLRGGQRREK